MKLKRYEILVTGIDWKSDLQECPDGQWVSYKSVEVFKVLYNKMREELPNGERYPEWE